ncbi:beta-lactamase-like protein [Gloeopeniophorella convolvens]|nr:beta-lactamase-like protein [Gloeopeniophorella convolvens]
MLLRAAAVTLHIASRLQKSPSAPSLSRVTPIIHSSPKPAINLSSGTHTMSRANSWTPSVTFLGTSSGGGPVESRNCSSLVVDAVGNGTLWMVDCGEGTLRQFSLQPMKGGHQTVRESDLHKIFITHMHADHVMGLPTLLRSVLGFPHPDAVAARGSRPKIEIYGPAGLRTLIRTTLSLTRTRTAERYIVHELLNPADPRTACDQDLLHGSEEPGQDIVCDQDGFWRNFTEGSSRRGAIIACAGPIIHRDPCIGYIFHEPSSNPYPRKLAILGDTSSAMALTALINLTPGRLSLLVHEATDAHIPASVDEKLGRRRTPAVVASKAEERGHSTPVQAGECAGRWGARMLAMNHIGSRFPAPTPSSRSGRRVAIMREIERQASEAWRTTPCEIPGLILPEEENRHAIAAYDFLTIHVPADSQQDLPVNAKEEIAGPKATRGKFTPKRRREG